MDRAINLRAAGFTLVAMLLFCLSDAMVKLLAAIYPPGQIMACRGVLSAAFLAALALRPRGGGPLDLSVLRDRACWLRGLLEIGVAFCFFAALARLPIADATALLFVFPVLLTVLAAFVLHEAVGWRRWLAIGAGLAGAVIMLRPGTAGFEPALLWPLAAAVCVAGRDLATRFLRPGSSSTAVALLTSCLTTTAGLATLPLGWQPVGGWALLGFGASALLVAAAFLALVEGTRAGDISFTAPLRYAVIPLSFLTGWLIWGQLPDVPVVLGSVIVVGSGLFILQREQRLARKAAAAART